MRESLHQVWVLLQSHRRAMVGVVSIGTAIQFIAILAPFCERLLIDRVYNSRNVTLANVLIGTSVGVTSAAFLARAARQCAVALLAVPIHLDVSVALYKHLLRLPAQFFECQRPGAIAGKFEDLSSAVRQWLSFLQTAATNLLFIVTIPLILFRTNVELATIGLIALPVAAALTHRQVSVSYRYLNRERQLVSELRAKRIDTLTYIKWVKGLSLEQYCEQDVYSATKRLADLQCEMHRTNRFYAILVAAFRSVSVGACIWLGWRFILTGSLTLGEFVAFASYLTYLYGPVSEFVATFCTLQDSIISFERVTECLVQSREDDQWQWDPKPTVQPRIVVAGSLGCENVTVAYAAAAPILENMNFLFERGSLNAIIGPSGSGKTTLLKVLVGLQVAVKGRVLMGNIDIRDMELSWFRSHISVVWQDSGLLTGTLWDNLTLGRDNICRSSIDRAVEICRLDSFVAALPKGYATRIGADGVTLSSGQKQRLAIAQAFLRDTPILLLDEATANVDLETERELLQSLFANTRDKLVVYVTHRPTSAVLADKVFKCWNKTVFDITQELCGATVSTATCAN